ncbi:hypothetical protein KVR01_009278 [Diaporthe batatas]|uniref:uncharacterized protein n=1 Tax=Diaporthe batatas TaxID=748121 RepID=UPI001D048682|nr:uncharacterized protein KVR01_009278 [Diaporthe batatas]KAG8161014.1 hypothetical protein KVR01_009278 [Diaporthe batatas]
MAAQEFHLDERPRQRSICRPRAWPVIVMASSEDDPSQWTRIVRKGKGKKLGRKEEILSLPVGGPPENFHPNRSPKLTVHDIKADHHKIASRWRTTEGYEQLCSTINDHSVSHQNVTRAVCLGIGAFDPEDGSWSSQRRSHTQLAAFLAIVDALRSESGQDIETIYQEPRFAQPDKEFLTSLGGKTVDSPGAYELINDTTLVFGVHLYRDIWADALKNGLPAMCVGTGWDVWEENPGADKSPDFDRVREMDAAFDKFPFPQDDYSSFSSTCIYWKKRDEKDGNLDQDVLEDMERLRVN